MPLMISTGRHENISGLEVEAWQPDVLLVGLKHFTTHPSIFLKKPEVQLPWSNFTWINLQRHVIIYLFLSVTQVENGLWKKLDSFLIEASIPQNALERQQIIPPGRRGRFCHQGVVLLQSHRQERACHCHSPGWSLPLLSGPWRMHSSGRGSYSGGRWAGMGYLKKRRTCNTMNKSIGTIYHQRKTEDNWCQENNICFISAVGFPSSKICIFNFIFQK